MVLDTLLEQQNVSRKEALQLFDWLDEVEVDFMTGLWKGRELKTDHPLDGLLEASGWFGKRIVNADTVDPLVFPKDERRLYRINPGLLPLSVPFSFIPRILVRQLAPKVAPFLKTKKSRARIRRMEYRGVDSAAMIYDQLPIIDVFRKVDERTVLGMMDMKGQQPYFFILERVG
ncbi:hypothetical protein B0X71_10105 [Planococcus lenghuensis]|uniref:DUF4334 domain-containing protein n=2 Tax=Planococcus lenghuensis TaxID=2213202 RepID=A0A1Q2L3S7_9BACL|nr:hypothetical protein B0X71_10105 [Planococcus lenghuensis]